MSQKKNNTDFGNFLLVTPDGDLNTEANTLSTAMNLAQSELEDAAESGDDEPEQIAVYQLVAVYKQPEKILSAVRIY